MKVQHPIGRLDQPASLHEITVSQTLIEVLLSIGEKRHRKGFSGASAGDADIGIPPISVLGVFVLNEPLDGSVSVP